MSGSINKVTLLGHLGADPEVRSFANGGRVCNLRIATSETWKDKRTGERQERTQWHQIAIFADGLVGLAEKFLRKGSKVYVEGQLETRKWADQNGQDRYSTEVVLRPFKGEIVFLDGKDSSQQSGGGNAPAGGYDQHRAGYSAQHPEGTDSGYPQGGAPAGGRLGDDIPFAPERRI